MKKVILLVIVAVLLIGAAGALNIKRLTVINKSGHDLYVNLAGQKYGHTHWLPIPKGTRAFPETKIWTVIGDVYNFEIWYESEDDLFSCIPQVGPSFYIDITRNTRLVVTECYGSPPHGEPGFVKWPPIYDAIDWKSTFKYLY